MLIEKLQAIAIEFDSAPGMRLYQAGEIVFQVLDRQSIRATIEILGNTPYRARIRIDGRLGLTLKFECFYMFLIKDVKTFLLRFVHVENSSVKVPGIGYLRIIPLANRMNDERGFLPR